MAFLWVFCLFSNMHNVFMYRLRVISSYEDIQHSSTVVKLQVQELVEKVE